jgi:hypothetical protein
VKEKLYYIQNGWLGNAIVWWAKDRKGYTTDIEKAGKYTKDEAKEIIQRPQDRAWECCHVDNCSSARRTVIDGQYLNKRYRLIGRKR